jgi:glyoxylase-like metal-dependent hydrolase (beta-lactamase superfamily II)
VVKGVKVPEILPGVHVVPLAAGVGTPGAKNVSMNICLLVEDGKITMVDAGLPESSAGLLAYMAEIGLAPQAIRRVIITHHHIDHVGGLPEVLELSGAEVWAHRDDAAMIEGTVPRPGIPPERIEAMVAAIPAEQRAAATARMKQMSDVAPVAVDLRLVGGEELNVLGGVQILHTPGHTAGHLSLYLPALSLLVAGDLLRLEDGVIRESPTGFAADADQALDSARQIATLGFESFIGYHGGHVVSGARELLSESLTR